MTPRLNTKSLKQPPSSVADLSRNQVEAVQCKLYVSIELCKDQRVNMMSGIALTLDGSPMKGKNGGVPESEIWPSWNENMPFCELWACPHVTLIYILITCRCEVSSPSSHCLKPDASLRCSASQLSSFHPGSNRSKTGLHSSLTMKVYVATRSSQSHPPSNLETNITPIISPHSCHFHFQFTFQNVFFWVVFCWCSFRDVASICQRSLQMRSTKSLLGSIMMIPPRKVVSA